MKLRPDQKVSLETARQRALAYMKQKPHGYGPIKASSVAYQIWPGAEFTSQGAGAAASRILKSLEADGLVRWTSNDHDWGWEITSAGRNAVVEMER